MYSISRLLKQELLDNQAIELCAKQCGTIGDITKLKICFLLRHHPELNVSTIAELVGASISNTSHSLNRLRNARLVKSRKQAQTVFYSLEVNGFDNVMRFIGVTQNDEL